MSFAHKFSGSAPNQNFVTTLIKQRALVYSLACYFDGDRAWYIFEVDGSKQKEFEKRFNNSEQVDFEAFGKILYSGWGEGPNEDLKVVLREKYGLYDS